MIRFLNKFLTISAALFFMAVLIFAIPSFYAPAFEVNKQAKTVGPLQPLSSRSFNIDDEAAVRFTVRYADGTEAHSEPLYFTEGIKLVASVSLDGIDVRYDHER